MFADRGRQLPRFAAAQTKTPTCKALLMPTRHLNWLPIIASLLTSTAPLYAQQQNVAKLKADARNLVGIIGSDKTKTQTYCQILDLIAQLDREKDSKKAKALSQKIDQLQKQLAPEFLAVTSGLQHLDLNSPDGREIILIIGSLNQSCPE
jgi:hypothetical protein